MPMQLIYSALIKHLPCTPHTSRHPFIATTMAFLYLTATSRTMFTLRSFTTSDRKPHFTEPSSVLRTMGENTLDRLPRPSTHHTKPTYAAASHQTNSPSTHPHIFTHTCTTAIFDTTHIHQHARRMPHLRRRLHIPPPRPVRAPHALQSRPEPLVRARDRKREPLPAQVLRDTLHADGVRGSP